jgi:hypothetical protein
MQVNGSIGSSSAKDVLLLATMDERHDTTCGQVIKKLCERAHEVFEEEAYPKLGIYFGEPSIQPKKVHCLSSPTSTL